MPQRRDMGTLWVLDSFKESNHVRRGWRSTAELRLSLRERVGRATESRTSEQDASSQRSALFRQWRPLSYPSSWSTVSSGPWGSCWIGKRTSPWPSASSWPWGQPEACTCTSVGRGRPEGEDESASLSDDPETSKEAGSLLEQITKFSK